MGDSSIAWFESYQDDIFLAQTPEAVAALVRDCIEALEPEAVAALPTACLNVLREPHPDMKKAAAVFFRAELAHMGCPRTALVLGGIAHTYTAAFLRLDQLSSARRA